jgi:membrane protein required for beta-lactamase induction
MTLLALLLALLAERAATRLLHLREARWLDAWYGRAEGGLAGREGPPGVVACALVALVPVLPVALAAGLFQGTHSRLAWLLFASLVLVFSLGPRDLDDEVTEYLEAESRGDQERARSLASGIIERDERRRQSRRVEAVEDAIFVAGNDRIFGVLFWFVVLGPTGLGPAGAWLFRVSDLLRRASIASLRRQGGDDAGRAALAHGFQSLHGLLAWAPARLVALGYSFAGSFEDARTGWRELYAGLPGHIFDRNDELLVRVGRGALKGVTVDGPAGPAAAALRLVRRTLVMWLSVIALLSLVAWVA